MAILKPARQRRKNLLLRIGFLKFEAHQLSKIEKPMDTPYINEMIRERSGAYEDAKKLGLSQRAWIQTIQEMYEDRGWTKRTKLLREVPDPWQMLRAWEDRYKDRQPDYTSPWQKKKKKRTDFEEKYPRGRIYNR